MRQTCPLEAHLPSHSPEIGQKLDQKRYKCDQSDLELDKNLIKENCFCLIVCLFDQRIHKCKTHPPAKGGACRVRSNHLENEVSTHFAV